MGVQRKLGSRRVLVSDSSSLSSMPPLARAFLCVGSSAFFDGFHTVSPGERDFRSGLHSSRIVTTKERDISRQKSPREVCLVPQIIVVVRKVNIHSCS